MKPPSLNSNADSKSHKMLYGINMLKHLVKKGGKDGAELRLEDLDENLLKDRLDRLEQELNEYKAKCFRYKKENEWYREEIETCQRDTAEYINYLENKQKEKMNSIDHLNDANRKDREMFNEKRKQKSLENQTKIEELKLNIMELESSIDAKQQDILKLGDIMGKRARHEAEIARIKKEMQFAESEHQGKVAEIERSMIETRFRIQRDADSKLQVMQSEAHEKAISYLRNHTSALEEENVKLEEELNRCNLKTQQQLSRKESLEKENRELEREQRLRQDLVSIRLLKIQQAQTKREAANQLENQKVIKDKKIQLQKALEHQGEQVRNLDSLDELDLDWSD